jgi:hypothetical protein
MSSPHECYDQIMPIIFWTTVLNFFTTILGNHCYKYLTHNYEEDKSLESEDNNGSESEDNNGSESEDNNGSESEDNDGLESKNNDGLESKNNDGLESKNNDGLESDDNDCLESEDNKDLELEDNKDLESEDNDGLESEDNKDLESEDNDGLESEDNKESESEDNKESESEDNKESESEDNKDLLYEDEIYVSEDDNDLESEDNNGSESEDNTAYDIKSYPSSPDITDDDLIADVRRISSLSNNKDVSSIEDYLMTPTVSSKENVRSQAFNALNQLSLDQAPIESMAESLISVTNKMREEVGKADHITYEKKQEFNKLLESVPEFINKIVDMDEEELGRILKLTIAPNNYIQNTILKRLTFSEEDRERESNYLMETLETLRK